MHYITAKKFQFMFDIGKDINNNNIFYYIIIKYYIFGYEYLINYKESNISLNVENYYFFMDYPKIKKSPNLNFESITSIGPKSGLFPGTRLNLPQYTIYIHVKLKKNEK